MQTAYYYLPRTHISIRCKPLSGVHTGERSTEAFEQSLIRSLTVSVLAIINHKKIEITSEKFKRVQIAERWRSKLLAAASLAAQSARGFLVTKIK